MRTVRCALAAGFVLLAGSAAANDSTAVLGAGGLRLVPNSDVELLSEDLRVAREEIRVRYVFRNVADEDETVRVAFPLPAIDMGYYAEVPLQQPYPDPLNFVGFTVTADGQAVEPEMEAKAVVEDRDVTERLEELGVPLSHFAPDLRDRLWALPREAQAALQAEGIAAFDYEYENVYPLWTLEIAFHWEQTFPAGREVVVEHTYRPVYGSSFVSRYSIDPAIAESQAWMDAFCIGEEERAEIARRLDAAGPDSLLLSDVVTYILTTATNWAGPIKRFGLTVDGGDPGNMVATCFPGLAPAGDGTSTVTIEDFVPAAELDVLVIRKDPES